MWCRSKQPDKLFETKKFVSRKKNLNFGERMQENGDIQSDKFVLFVSKKFVSVIRLIQTLKTYFTDTHTIFNTTLKVNELKAFQCSFGSTGN